MGKGAMGCSSKGGVGCASKGWMGCAPSILPPDCCQFNGCCFDMANARFRGNVVWHASVYGHTDGAGNCTGDHLADIEIEFDYNFPANCGEVDFDTSNTPSDRAYFSPIVKRTKVYPAAGGDGTTWQELPWATSGDGVANLQIFGQIQWRGGGEWWVQFQMDFDVYVNQADQSDVNTRIQFNNAFVTGTSDDPTHFHFAGDCMGLTDEPSGSFFYQLFDAPGQFMHYPVIDTCATYMLTALLGDTRSMTVANNYCCLDGELCVATEVPNAAGSGLC